MIRAALHSNLIMNQFIILKRDRIDFFIMVQVVDIEPTNGNKRRRRYHTIEDSDDEELDEKKSFGDNLTPGTEIDQCAADESLAKRLQDLEHRAVSGRNRLVQILSDSDEEEEEEVNPITITLQRCDQIAASLREELQASSSSDNSVNEDRYAEVDVAAAKIVSQVWRSFTLTQGEAFVK